MHAPLFGAVSDRLQKLRDRIWELREDELLPEPEPKRKVWGAPVFSVHADTVVTYGKDPSYSDGVKCVARRGGRFMGMCWHPRGWYIGDPMAGVVAYAHSRGLLGEEQQTAATEAPNGP